MSEVVEEIPLDSEGVPAAPETEAPLPEPVEAEEPAPPPPPKKRGRPPKPPAEPRPKPAPKKRGRPPRPQPPPEEQYSDDEPPYTTPGLDTLAVAADVLRLLSAQKATRMEQKRDMSRSWIL